MAVVVGLASLLTTHGCPLAEWLDGKFGFKGAGGGGTGKKEEKKAETVSSLDALEKCLDDSVSDDADEAGRMCATLVANDYHLSLPDNDRRRGRMIARATNWRKRQSCDDGKSPCPPHGIMGPCLNDIVVWKRDGDYFKKCCFAACQRCGQEVADEKCDASLYEWASLPRAIQDKFNAGSGSYYW